MGGKPGTCTTPGFLKKIKIEKQNEICQILIEKIKITSKCGAIYISKCRPTTIGRPIKISLTASK
jgi:hypothetical protein